MGADRDEQADRVRASEKPDEPLEWNWRILLHRLKQTGCLVETDRMRVKGVGGGTLRKQTYTCCLTHTHTVLVQLTD